MLIDSTRQAVGIVEMANSVKKKLFHGGALFVVLIVAACLMVCTGCNGDVSRFAGIWDLKSVENSKDGLTLSAEEVQAMRELGIETYLNLDENGSLTLVNFDRAQRGSWELTGHSAADVTIDGQKASIRIEGDTLRLIQQEVTLVFQRGNDEDRAEADEKLQQQTPSEETDSNEVGTETATTELSEMVVRGSYLSEPIILVEDAICTIVVDGTGVDKWGDPGLNLQITNNSETNIDVWIKDAFTVGEKTVRVYLFETVSPRRSLTSFMQFDTDDLESTNIASLENISGTILIDNDEEVTIGCYSIALESVAKADENNLSEIASY